MSRLMRALSLSALGCVAGCSVDCDQTLTVSWAAPLTAYTATLDLDGEAVILQYEDGELIEVEGDVIVVMIDETGFSLLGTPEHVVVEVEAADGSWSAGDALDPDYGGGKCGSARVEI